MLVDDCAYMSSEEYEPPRLEEMGSVEDVTGGNNPGSADGNSLTGLNMDL
jgi:hypothetical protein